MLTDKAHLNGIFERLIHTIVLGKIIIDGNMNYIFTDEPVYNSHYDPMDYEDNPDLIVEQKFHPKSFERQLYKNRQPRRFVDTPELRNVFGDHNLTTKDQMSFLDSLSKTPKLDKNLKEAEKVFEPSVILGPPKRTKRSFDPAKLYLDEDDYYDGLGGILGESVEPEGKSSMGSNLENETLIKANQGADKREEKYIKDIW